jgi:signal transduction histidine kinase
MSQRVTSISVPVGATPAGADSGFGPPPLALGAIGFERMAAALPHGVAVVRFDRVVWANDPFVRLIAGAASNELHDVAFTDLFHDTGRGVLDSNAAGPRECGVMESNGGMRNVICHRVWSGRDPDVAVWCVDDATRMRSLESEILLLSRQLHDQNRKVASLQDQLRCERTDREDMLGVVSHELRTPVTIIGGYNRLLLSEEVGPLTEEQRRFLEESSNACRRLGAFIANLLEAPAASANGAFLEFSNESLEGVVAAVVGLLRPILAARGLEVRVAIEPDAERLKCDRMRIEQVLRNLIENAIKHSPQGASIDIGGRRIPTPVANEPDSIEISVSDRGPGVAESDRERIFAAYVQTRETCGGEGFGLGLAVCKRLVEAHRGSIAVTGRPGGGSRFAFILPDGSCDRGA